MALKKLRILKIVDFDMSKFIDVNKIIKCSKLLLSKFLRFLEKFLEEFFSSLKFEKTPNPGKYYRGISY